MRRHLGFLIFFCAIIFIFLGKLIFMKGAFLGGDYLVQFYPWAKIYSESIKNLNFPFWTRYFHSGFPLMAEGQIGGFYPINILLYYFLPFNIAYNYSIIIHFILGGIFIYFYTRDAGADQWGGSLACLVFCFGSAYAGCFYNIVTLRTLAWFPLVLFLMEMFFKTERPFYIIISGVITGTQFLAGFVQMAVYSLIFYIIYLLYGIAANKINTKLSILMMTLFLFISTLVASPQLILTHQLLRFSNRALTDIGFALWKSFFPPAFLTLFFPKMLDFLGSQFFIGVFTLLFLMYTVWFWRDTIRVKSLLLIAAIAILAALGRYNPLYIIVLKVTGFYGFRNPSKFLFFALFAASVLSGLGFSKFFNHREKDSCRVARLFASVLSLALAIFFVTRAALIIFKENLIILLQEYTKRYIYGRPFHRYDLQTYLTKANKVFGALMDTMDLGNIYVVFSIFMVILGILAGIYLYKVPQRRRFLKVPIFFLIFIDIWVYSYYGIGFRGNIGPLRPHNGYNKILEVISSDNDLFRVAPFDIKDKKMVWWLRPNANILVGIDSIAAYTPLAARNYRDHLLSLEVVDDSLGVLNPASDSLSKSYQLLRLLNVKYVVSMQMLQSPFLIEQTTQDGLYLYRLKDYLPRLFFCKDIKSNILVVYPTARLEIMEYRSGFVEIEVAVDEGGFLVFSEYYYPGWRVYVDDGAKEIIEVAGMIQAVKIGRGSHKVIFKFKPQFLSGRM